MNRCYSELILLPTFIERFRYLKLDGRVCEETFGFDRYLNQRFYTSREWKMARDFVIARDLGCDLGVNGMPVHGRVYIHHMNPLSKGDIQRVDESMLDPEYLVTVSLQTHNAIHYGDESQIFTGLIERRPNDTTPWNL